MAEVRKHSLLSPSSAYRWLLCPGSVARTKDLPNPSSPYAAEGTKAHRLAELALTEHFSLRSLTEAEKAEQAEGSPEMAAYVVEYVKAVEEALGTTEPDYFDVEHRLDISGITGEEGAYGTADCVAIVGRALFIIDFKYGAGVKVEAEAEQDDGTKALNFQLCLYALAALDELDPMRMFFGIEKVRTLIVQPRMKHVGHTCNAVGDFDKYREKFRKAAQYALNLVGLAPAQIESALRPGEAQCRWCLGKRDCPAFTAKTRAGLLQDFGPGAKAELPAEVEETIKAIPVPDTPEMLAKAYGYLPLIKQWVEAVDKAAMSRLLAGEKVPGLKLVQGRAGIRKWSNTEEAEQILVKAVNVAGAYDKTVISPTAAERLMKAGKIGPRYWKRLQELTTRAEPKPVIAPESDSRAEYVPPKITAADFI